MIPTCSPIVPFEDRGNLTKDTIRRRGFRRRHWRYAHALGYVRLAGTRTDRHEERKEKIKTVREARMRGSKREKCILRERIKIPVAKISIEDIRRNEGKYIPFEKETKK